MASHSILTVDESRSRKRKNSGRRPIWTDLPEDVLRLVVEWLFLVDRIHLRAVCKNWAALPIHDIPLFEKLPWVMYYFFSPHQTICSFFEPCRKLPYTMEEERGWITAGSLLSRATARASRFGWVLFSEKIRHVVNSTPLHMYQYCVYNPLTKDIISLPRLELPHHRYHYECLATFTSHPTSPDCVFIVPTVSGGHYLYINTYSIGNKTWKTHNTPPSHAMRYMGGSAMAYIGGSVYCYNIDGGLSSFHIATQKWRLLTRKRPPIDCIKLWDFVGPWYIVPYGGHLHLVCLGQRADMVSAKCKIFKFDWLDGGWRKMESLEGGVMFLGNPSFGVAAGEQTKMVANRVYYFSRRTSTPSFLVYGSPGMGETSEFSGNQTYYEPCPEKIQSFGESRSWMWMEPPFLTS